MLLIFGGLPGTGKTTIARQVAQKLSAAYIRMDSLELALVRSGLAKNQWDLGPAGYIAGYALAADNLRLGLSVVADSVNPLRITRNAWRDIAVQEGVDYLEIEIICSDTEQHKERVEGRSPDISGHVLPDWQSVVNQKYEPWDRERIVLDTAKLRLMWPSVKYLRKLAGMLSMSPIFLAFSIMAKMRANKTDLEFPAPSLGLIHDDQCSYQCCPVKHP